MHDNLCFENNLYTCGVGGGLNVVNAPAILRQIPYMINRSEQAK